MTLSLNSRTRVVTVLCALALLLAGTPRTATATSDTSPLAVGAHVHAMWSSYDTATRAAVFDRLAAAGVRWIRVDIGWASLEYQCRGCHHKWHLSRLDEILQQAADRDIQVLGMLWRTPPWANDGDVLAPPHDPADYGNAAGWIAERFAGRVAAWQIWNEPNLDDFYHGTMAEYVALLRAAYPAIHAADPNAKVVLGGPSKNDTAWLRDLYVAGAKPYFDIMSTHPYMAPANAPPETPSTGPDDKGKLTHVEVVRDLMVAKGDGHKPIWFTEFGWSSHDNEPGTPNWQLGVTEKEQADYLGRALRLIETNYPYVTHAFWYSAKEQTSTSIHLNGYGLLRPDLTPKPAYHALANHLAGTTSPKPSPTSPTPNPTSPKPSPTPEKDRADGRAMVTRVAGGDRIATAVTVSRQHWTSSSDVVLATARDFPDALAAGALTARLDAPLLLTDRDHLPSEVAAEIDRLGAHRVHVLGGPVAISEAVADQLRTQSLEVRRLAGPSRFETARVVAGAAGAPGREAAVVLGAHPDPRRDAWPDALAAGALAASSARVPTLLAAHDRVPDATLAALEALDVDLVTVVGGPSSVSDAVLSQLQEAGHRTRRLAGGSRYSTSAATANAAAATSTPDHVVLATGAAFPDGLSAIALAAHLGGTVMLAPPSGLADASELADLLRARATTVRGVVLVGGEQALSSRLAADVDGRIAAGN